MHRMTWRWQLEKADGTVVNPPSVGTTEFSSRGDAESWVGETYAELAEAGVDQVRLFEGEREVYGPMGLHPEG